MAALMNMDGPSYDTELGEMRGLSTITFMHARFCQVNETAANAVNATPTVVVEPKIALEISPWCMRVQPCERILDQFAEAAATLVEEGYPRGVRSSAMTGMVALRICLSL